MSQTTQTDIITLSDVATRLPNFITKVPHILNGLKQAYLRTPTSPASSPSTDTSGATQRILPVERSRLKKALITASPV